MKSELGNIVASGRATQNQWNEYWSAYAENLKRQGQTNEQQESEQAKTGSRQKDRSSEASLAGIGLGSAIAIVLSFQLNHSILWAILHGILSWFYVLYRAWQGNY